MQRAPVALSIVLATVLLAPGATADSLPDRFDETGGPSPLHLAARPPVAIAPVPGAVVRPFAPPQTRYGPGHRGVDLSATPDDLVVAAMDGVVTFAGKVAGEPWLTLRHADGLETTYGGVVATVRAGQQVAIGQAVGRLRHGRRHLDWGVRFGEVYLDPAGLLIGWRAMLVPVTDA